MPDIAKVKLGRFSVTVYRAADLGFRYGWNRYNQAQPWQSTIGCFVVVASWCVSIVWGKPKTSSEWIKNAPVREGE